MGPNRDQYARDALDDHNVVDHQPAGDGPEIRTTPGISVLAHRAEAAHTRKPLTESR